MLMFTVMSFHDLLFLAGYKFLSAIAWLVLGPLVLAGTSYYSEKIETLYFKNGTNVIATFFGIGTVALLLLSIAVFVFSKNTTTDIQVLDTYYIIANFHFYIPAALILGFWSVIYFITSKIVKINLNSTLSEIHFWSTLCGILIFLLSITSNGMATGPRRYYSFDTIEYHDEFGFITLAITISTILILVSQLIFVLNLIYSLTKQRKRKT